MGLFTLLVLFLIYVTLKYINRNDTSNIERFNEIISTALDDALFEVQQERLPLQTSSGAGVGGGGYTFSSGSLTVRDIQHNQGLIFDKFITAVNENNNAKKVLLLESDNPEHDLDSVYPLQDLKDKIDQMETTLNSKLGMSSECDGFTNYCYDTDGNLNQTPSLYSDMSAAEFVTKLNACYDVCSTVDTNYIQEYRKLLYDTLFDILLRNGVLEKVQGNTNNEENHDRYEYLIQNNRNPEIPNIRFDMGVFTNRHIDHLRFVDELHTFLKIVNLDIRKIRLNNAIYNDNKEIIKNHYIIKHNGVEEESV